MTQDRLTLPHLTAAAWSTSSHSGRQGDCVEVAPNLPHLIPVRDSTRPTGPVIAFGREAWQALVGDLA
ncbi:DUF397 domain-containing protein [Streptomyces fimicarius]